MHLIDTLLGGLLVGITLALGGLQLVRRYVAHPVRQANTTVAGVFMGGLGGTYAVLLACMAVVVWQQFDAAQLAVEQESNALIALYQLGGLLPQPERAPLRELLRDYATAMRDEEWPALAHGQPSAHAANLADQLWVTVAGRPTSRADEQGLQTQLLRRLDDLDDHRELIEHAAGAALPPIMWVLLLGGAAVSTGLTYFCSTPHARAQSAMTALYVTSIVLVLVLIGMLDLPFASEVHLTADGLTRALETFHRIDHGELVQRPAVPARAG